MLFLIKYLQELPERTLVMVCLTMLLMPLSISLGGRLNKSENISFEHGQTQFKLGQIKQNADAGEKASQKLQNDNYQLSQSVRELKAELEQQKIQLRSIEALEKAIANTENSAEDLISHQEEINDLTEEVVEDALESQEENQSFSPFRGLIAKIGGIK